MLKALAMLLSLHLVAALMAVAATAADYQVAPAPCRS